MLKRFVFLVVVAAVLAMPAMAIQDRGRGPNYDTQWFAYPNGAGTLWMDDIENLAGSSVALGTGQIFYVDSNVTTEGDGTSWEQAKDTLDEAIGLCTADRGDLIKVAQGHTETMGAAADEVDNDISGVTVEGIGNGKLRPLFDFTGDWTGAFAIGADDITLINLHFVANVTDVNEAIQIEAGAEQVTIASCLFTANAEGTDEFATCIDSEGAASDRLTVIGCEFAMGAGAAVSAIHSLDSDYKKIIGNLVTGDYSTAVVFEETTASNHIVIRGNSFFNGTIGGAAGMNTEPCLELVATTSGMVIDNDFGCNLATMAASLVGADMICFRNYYNEDEGGGATGTDFGTPSADG